VENAAAPRGSARAPAGRGPAPRVGLIHRLDRDASGLLVFSKTHDEYLSLKRQLFERSVERVYAAVVAGVPKPPKGTIDSRLVERADGTVYSTKRPGEGERAVSEYEVVEAREGRALVRVTLRTGRKHQIRVHLSERGWPIVGDAVYGSVEPGRWRKETPGGASWRPAAPAGPRLMLAATKLSFTHPRTGGRLTFERPAPGAFAAAFESGPGRGSR
jgi:23S rRNA pseudouridine1911/1915/1917 synthase